MLKPRTEIRVKKLPKKKRLKEPLRGTRVKGSAERWLIKKGKSRD